MEIKYLNIENLEPLLHLLKDYGKVFIPAMEFSKSIFKPFDEIGIQGITLKYEPTNLPAKSFVSPPREVIFEYKKNREKTRLSTVCESEKTVIFGMHTCDLHALTTTDTIYSYQYKDINYNKRREELTIIALECMEVCNENSFCRGMNTWKANKGYDLMLVPVEEQFFIVRSGSSRGDEILENPIFENVTNEAIAKWLTANQYKENNFPERLNKTSNEVRIALKDNYNNPLWKELAEKCYSCGSCNIVCPTCHCYAVVENISVDANTAHRERMWDACLRKNFTLETSGHNARDNTEDRLRHRFMKKGMYTLDKFGTLGCVGCGRCISACLTGISILDVFNSVSKRTKTIERTKVHSTEPYCAKIKSIKVLTPLEKVFEIEVYEGFKHKPGQFVEVSIFGVGEVPISISSSPTRKDNHIELCIRTTGTVTQAIHKLKKGNNVWIRGPFGNGFQPELFKNKNLLFIAGGLGYAPLRSFINYALDKKNDYRKVTIFYGTKNPESFLYKEELDALSLRKDIDFELTVDIANSNWRGMVGPVTNLLKGRKFETNQTIVAFCGPPIMYKHVLKYLLELGFPDENIYMSLERRMECGIGMCGHCQFEDQYVCLDGPVFRYSEIKSKEEAI
ncbi:MAG: 4Fe-4S dicluster domain-containing protein [Leptospiraceae bacterium]|nr:4Fe-4S dicluster domain-containing protein [Leptospiraceae bacterium]MCP5502561.1 4Fe-4S dicluster domain-containing protein [Leptospiraceae bacterium]